MRYYHPSYERYNPSRSPSWRFDRARLLARDGSGADARRDDELTLRAAEYLCALGSAACPHLPAAHRVHVLGGELRWELEARLLAGQTSGEIARAMPLNVPTIDTFEAFFFNVRDRLDARDWVTWKAIGPLNTLAAVWKAVAYHGGPLPLAVVIACTSARPRGVSFPKGLLRKARQLVSSLLAPPDAVVTPTPPARAEANATPRGKRQDEARPALQEIVALAEVAERHNTEVRYPTARQDWGDSQYVVQRIPA